MKLVVDTHLKTVFIEHAAAVDFKSETVRKIDENGLSISKLLALSGDGLNVNIKLFQQIDSEKRELTGSQSLLNIGSWKFHLVQNAFVRLCRK